MSASVLATLLASTLAFSPWSVGAPAVDTRPTASLAMLGSIAAGPEEAAPDEGSPDEGGDVDDGGWGDEDTVEALPDEEPPTDPVAPTGPEVGAPTAADAAAAAGTYPTGIEKKPAPEPDRSKRGFGLLIATGAVAAVAWGAAGARIGIVQQCVTDQQQIQTILDCVTEIPRYLGLTVLVWLANDTTYGLAPAAGVVRGRYEASEYVYSGKYDRKGQVWTGVGGGLLGVGIVAKVSMWAMSFNVFKCDVVSGGMDLSELDDCIRRRWTGMLLGHQFASGMIAGGAGALGYGLFYTKDRKSREKLFFRPQQVRLSPYGSGFDSMGLQLTGRF